MTRLCLLTAALLAVVPSVSWQAEPKPLTAEQKDKLKERDRWEAEVKKLQAAGKLDAAVAAAENMLAIERDVFGSVHNEVVNSLMILGTLHERREDFAAARKVRAEALAAREKVHGKDHWKTTDARLALTQTELLGKLTPEQRQRLRQSFQDNERVVSLYREGKFREAVRLAESSAAVRKELLGEAHPDYAMSLNNLALIYHAQGDYARAEPLCRQALEIQRKALGEAHPDYATSLNNLAGLYRAQGDYAKAEPLFRQAPEIYKKALGEAHPSYAASLNNLAGLYDQQGDYAKAEPLYRQALEIRRKALGEAHPDYANSLHNLAGLYRAQGDFAKAEPLFRKALEIQRKALGEAHPAYAASLNNLAELYQAQGDYAKAEPLYRQALEIRRKALGEAHPGYASSLHHLAYLYQARGDYAKAEPLHRQALEIQRKALGEAHPNYATSLHNLASLYREQGDYAKAEPLVRQFVEIKKKALGEAHPDYATSLHILARLYQAQGDYARAEPLHRLALRIVADHLDATAAIQSERQQLRMAEKYRPYLDSLLSNALAAKVAPTEVAAPLLQAKGAVFVRQLRQRQLLGLAGAGDEPGRIAADLAAVSRRLATLAGATPRAEQAAAWQKQLADLAERKERLEADLSRLSADFRKQKARERLTPEQLADRLPADIALIDLLEYRHSTPIPEKKGKLLKERRLLATVLRKGKPVALIPLGPVQPIADAVESWRLTLKRTQPLRGEDDPARVLRDRLWLPLVPYLAGATTVLISPDGVTARVPFAALPGTKPDTYLIEEVRLAVVPVPQLLPDLLDRPADAGGEPSLLLAGAIDYDAEPGQAATGGAGAVRSGARNQWQALAGTRAEMAAIKDSFDQRFPDGKARTLRGAAATEAALREQMPRHRWLHLATHGFFAPPEVKALGHGDNQARGGEASSEWALTGHDPGLLSGLVLAGANRPPAVDQDDGILTALEVQALDLRKVELAVLSACETGLGATAGGEGVLGLQRAFQVAGARATVTSLWSVDDKATQQLMVRFYENRWEKKMAVLEALTEAQRWMLAEGLKRGLVRDDDGPPEGKPRTPPYYWAAFVLSGDWR